MFFGVDKQLNMADIGKMDERVKEYLVYRGLSSTVKAFENELKADKDRVFRVDKIMDQIHSYISGHEITGLRDYWTFLEQHVFASVDAPFTVVLHRLTTNIFRIYLVNAIQSGKNDKVSEFFEKMTPQLHSLPEWKDWFVLPFTKNPEEQQPFMICFNKQWQDTMFLCLHNFLSSILVNMRKPVLLNYENDGKLIKQLENENVELRKQISLLQTSSRVRTKSSSVTAESHPANESGNSVVMLSSYDTNDLTDSVDPYSMPQSVELLDDFYAISQSTPEADKPAPRSEQFKSFIRNIGLPSSPVMAKKPSSTGASSQTTLTTSTAMSGTGVVAPSSATTADRLTRPSGNPLPRPQSAKALADSVSLSVGNSSVASSVTDGGAATANLKGSSSDVTSTVESNSPFLLLSQDEYKEHAACIAQCRFSPSGETIATLDIDGVLKTWTLQPFPVTVWSTMSKSVLTSMEWANDRMLLLGSKVGSLRLFDIKEKKVVKDILTDTGNPYPRIVSFATHPLSTTFAVSGVGRLRGNTADCHAPRVGRVSIWDLKAMKLERHLPLAPGPIAVNCMTYNHNGQLLLTGAADGIVRLYDVKSGETIGQWVGHVGEVYTVSFSSDETCCYTMGSDGKLTQWSANKMGQKISDLPVHPGASGPFVKSGVGNQKADLMLSPRGKLFALDNDGNHMLTCSSKGGIIYKLDKESGFERICSLEGHKSSAICVDWSASVHYKLCLTASVDGRVRVSTLLTK